MNKSANRKVTKLQKDLERLKERLEKGLFEDENEEALIEEEIANIESTLKRSDFH